MAVPFAGQQGCPYRPGGNSGSLSVCKEQIPGPQAEELWTVSAYRKPAARDQTQAEAHRLQWHIPFQSHSCLQCANRYDKVLEYPRFDEAGQSLNANADLNKSILSSQWGQLAQLLDYKCRRFVRADLKHRNQVCHRRGRVSQKNRKSQAAFLCLPCDLRMNADLDKTINILVRYGWAILASLLN